MARSNTSSNLVSNQVPNQVGGQIPLCGCRLPMHYYVAGTDLNRGRTFWRCLHWGKPISCKLFVWDDEIHLYNLPMVSVGETSEPNVDPSSNFGQCKCGELFKDWESKKVSKLKQKLLDEKKKNKWMQAMLILVILFVAFQKFDVGTK